jgi:cation:H+ antiporter
VTKPQAIGEPQLHATPEPHPPAALALLLLAMALSIPGMVLYAMGHQGERAPVIGLVVFGCAIVAAAFVLTWAAEVAQLDIGSSLAIVFIALVTVLPEYAVDMLLAWNGAVDPEYQPLALANMTGANRLLIGIGWPVVALLVWYKRGERAVLLEREHSPGVVWLLAATLYSCVIPLKGNIAWYDALVLILIYAVYVKTSKNEPEEVHDLVGPPRVVARWPRPRRRWTTIVLFVWSATAILMCAEPFVESLIGAGHAIGISEYFLIQWLAPFASESPEFVVVVLLTLRGRATMGFGAFVSSKVNQWTLLVGGIPLAYGLSHLVNKGSWAAAMPLTGGQTEELWLTITQGLYAVAAIADLNFSLRQALIILALFLVQLVGSVVLETTGHHAAVEPFHNALSVLYTLLAIERLATQRRDMRQRLGDVFGGAARRGVETGA